MRLTLLVFNNNSQAISFSCLDRQPCSGWYYALPAKKNTQQQEQQTFGGYLWVP